MDSGQATTGTPGRRSRSAGGPLTPRWGEHALTVEHLSKRFGNRIAFEDVSFDVGYGEVFGFLGPNGAGKIIASAIYAGSHVLVQLLFTPLLAGWGIWVGIAVSARSTDVRVAQQLSVLGSLPLLAILALMSLNVIAVSTGLAVGLAAACWPSTCSPGEPWQRCSTASD